MERQNRRELLEVISHQKEQMTRYETRLKDVVRAYKGLAKEKETLETSLKAITAAVNEERDHEEKRTETDATEDTECDTDVESIAESTSSEMSSVLGGKPKAKLAALSNSLAAVTAEKSQAEAKFLADKRKMKNQKDELLTVVEKLKKSEEEIKVNLEETKSKLIVERHERENEMQNSKLMMQELQKLVSQERHEKEQLGGELMDLKSKVFLMEDPARSRQAEGQLQAVKQELDTARAQLSRSEARLREQNQTETKITALQSEMNELKRKHVEQLQGAEEAREAAELRALNIQRQQENRVANLESHLQELSESVGSYEKLRTQDLTAIAGMREEIDVLNSENVALASRAASTEPPVVEVDEKVDFDKIVEKVLKYKHLLIEAANVSEVEGLYEVFKLPQEEDYRATCLLLQDELGKVRAAQEKPTTSTPEEYLGIKQETELSSIKTAYEELKIKFSFLKEQNNDLEKCLKGKTRELLEERQNSEKEQTSLKMENSKQMTVLHLELQEQRERSLTMLEEKDSEIQRLMNQVETAVEEAFYSPEKQRTSRSCSKSPMGAMLPRKISVGTLEMGSSTSRGDAGSSGPPLHYVQELSRKEVEIKELRAQQFQSETNLREIQLKMSAKEEKYQDRIELLEETICRLERMTTMSRGDNTEYLKNVVLNYMLSTDIGSKNHMLKAIGAVLRLTEKEVQKVMVHNQKWWWKQNRVAGGSSSAAFQ